MLWLECSLFAIYPISFQFYRFFYFDTHTRIVCYFTNQPTGGCSCIGIKKSIYPQCLQFFIQRNICIYFNRMVAERVWISIDCLSIPCIWGVGDPVTWTQWGPNEPLYESGVLEYANSDFLYWGTRKNRDLYISLCFGKC